MENTFVQLLLTPDRFFQEKSKDSENLKKPALIVLIVGLIAAISAYYVTQMTMKILPSEMESFGGITVTLGVIGGTLAVFVMWVVVTIIFFILSLIFKGKGNFTRALEFVGYGFAPQIMGGIINIVLTYNFAITANIARVPYTSDYTAMGEAINNAMKTLVNNPWMQLVTIVGIVFLIWSANIWIFSIKHGRNLETKNAAIVVLIPLAIYIAYTLMNLTTLFGGI